MPANVIDLAERRTADSAALIAYLAARLSVGDLQGLVVQSLGRGGKERIHLTGEYKRDPGRAPGVLLAMSVRITAVAQLTDDAPII